MLGVIQRRNNNIGNSALYVTTLEGAVSYLHDLNECQSKELNDCHKHAICINSWGRFLCTCEPGFRDPLSNQPLRAGRICESCPKSFCNNQGNCSYTNEGIQRCLCDKTHFGSQCEIDEKVLIVAIVASTAAVIVIVLTLTCLVMWSRTWQKEGKSVVRSNLFGYMNTIPVKSTAVTQPCSQISLEDRMRWTQIAKIMAQKNHYRVIELKNKQLFFYFIFFKYVFLSVFARCM